MQDDAQKYEEEDKKKLEQINIKNNADNLIYTTEKTLTENDAKLQDDIKADVRLKLERLISALKGDDYDVIKSMHEELMQASFKMSESLYNNAEPNQDIAQEHVVSAAQEDNVIDAEVVG